MEKNYDAQATVAALLEKYMGEIDNMVAGAESLNSFKGLENYTLLDKGYTTGAEGGVPTLKALVVKNNETGAIYVHYRGTGDSFWPLNSVAYGPVDGKTNSSVQEWAADFFDRTIDKFSPSGEIYVTGHSQGGNNAQFVTMRSKNADKVTACVELDGQGFSHQFVEETRRALGEAEYAKRCEKIYAYVGDSDFVSALGQEHIIPEDHYQVIQTIPRPDELGKRVPGFHESQYFTDENGNLNPHGEISQFRAFVIALNEKVVKELPQEDQRRLAHVAMELAENGVGNEPYKVTISREELQDLKVVVPAVLKLLEEDPDLVRGAVEMLNLDPAIVELIDTVIVNFNELPMGIRQDAVKAIMDGIITKEDGSISFDASKMGFGWIDALEGGIPLLLDTLIHDPDQVLEVIRVKGVDKIILDMLEKNPEDAVGGVLTLPFALPALKTPEEANFLIDALIHVVQTATKVMDTVKNFVLKTLIAIKERVERLVEWFKSHSRGARYADANPFFKVDTQQLRTYAYRLSNVNRRLKDLDTDLNNVYLQVGLLDVLSILYANLITRESSRLKRIIRYLGDAANEFEEAENKAKGYVGNGG